MSNREISYDLDSLLQDVDNMDYDGGTSYELQFSAEGEDKGVNVPLTVFRLLVCVLGILGNLLVIFVILVLAEYRKAVTHWYVLQLAIADSIFLLTIPFRVAEDIDNAWNFPVWMCKAKETILFLNYYSSISFLVVMSIDRYIAVCHGFSSFLQKFRTPLAAAIITVGVWTVCLLICIPIMMYSTPRGHMPNCKCEYQFPKEIDANQTCVDEGETPGTPGFEMCISQFADMSGSACANLSMTSITLGGGSGSGAFGFDYSEIDMDNFNAFATEETTVSPFGEEAVEKPVFLQPGCHYFDYAEGFKAFLWFNFIVMFLIPLGIMTVCYALIVYKLYGTRFRTNSSSGAPNSITSGSVEKTSISGGSKRKRIRSAASAKNNRNRIRVTLMCACMVILFFICWLPFHSVHLAKMGGIPGTPQFCLNLFYATSLIAFANSAINPYLYNFIGTRFGKRLSSAASTVRKSVKKQSSSISGSVAYHYRKRPADNGTSHSQTGTVMTKIFKGKSEGPTSADLSSNVFSDDSKHNEEQQKLTTTVSKSPEENNSLEPITQQLIKPPPDYDTYKKGLKNGEFSSRV